MSLLPRSSTVRSSAIDPQHDCCVGGRVVSTCPVCAGNAPRGSTGCVSCCGTGVGIAWCSICEPRYAEGENSGRGGSSQTIQGGAGAGAGAGAGPAPTRATK